MFFWKRPLSLESLAAAGANCAIAHVGIEFLEVGENFIRARMPVDARTHQPFGLLHGGMSVVLAETLGSIAAIHTLPEGYQAVGLDINANHLKGMRDGWVYGVARPVHVGRSTQVWAIELSNEAGELVCVSRITMAVLAPRPAV